ncbi:IclR family transcriptional regulator domain-containing protein [Imbroritus primus]|uniref:IclR family transcriptional regulator domain-containing protein n=1 Tax=Imbroritus primus TaxID=3058603 RepID=UPI003D160799
MAKEPHGGEGSEGKREFLDALANGLRLLSSFDAQTRSTTIQSAAELLGVTRAAARRILLTLTELGYLQQQERYFELTPKALELGYRYFRSLGLSGAVRPYLQKLARELHVAAAIGVLAGPDVLFVDRVEAERPIKLDLRAGDRLPAYAHSLGRALLAQLPETELADHLPAGALPKASPYTVADRQSLRAELVLIRQRGWSFANSELVAGLFGVGIALPSRGSGPTIGLNVSSIGTPWTVAHIEEHIVPALQATAQEISILTDSLA